MNKEESSKAVYQDKLLTNHFIVQRAVNHNKQIYRNNLKSLREHYPMLAKKVEKCKNDQYEQVSSTIKGLPNLRDKTSGLNFYADDILQDIEEQMTALSLRENRLAIFLGMGLGYELLHYMQLMTRKLNTSYILVIEKDLALFKMALEMIDLQVVISHPLINLVVGEPEENLYIILRKYVAEKDRFAFAKSMKPVYHLSSLRLNKEYYLKALKQLREAITSQLLYYGNDPYDSLLGIENMFSNLDEIISNPGINLLYNKFVGKPAVVVSTGPSLNKNKHLLKGLENKALIIAADASLKVLMGMGVKPHLVTSLERIKLVSKHFEGFSPEEVNDVYMAACPVIFKEVYQSYPGPRIIVYRNFDHFRWLEIERGILDIKLSAGNMAFKVAEALGCDPIILIGQDLAFSRDGKTHAAGSALGENQPLPSVEMLEVMGNDGKPIMTNKTWNEFLQSYELDISSYHGTCINSTEGGAFIKGTRVMPFQESIDEFIREDFYPLKIIRNNLSGFSRQDAENDLHHVKQLINSTISELREIIGFCMDGIATHGKYKEELEECFSNPEKYNQIKNQINEIEEEINENKNKCRKLHHTYQLFFAHVFQSFSIKFEMEMIAVPQKYEDPYMAIVEIMLRQAEWYAVIGDLAGICLRLLKQSAKELEG